ncbi:MAG: pyridoxamine 5'-phosphate oxidase family protein [Lachnospiraceae bacterium]|nr:pyridoxamine 5'-phosphate oxidase family protein [Lachnospiraceae bacterium]
MEGLEKLKAFLRKQPVMYIAVTGLDKRPDVHPAELCYEEDGALYFAAAKCETFYGELSMDPVVRMCVLDRETGVLLNLRGKAVFTEDETVVSRCIRECRSVREAWGHEPGMLIAWFLRDVVFEFVCVKDGTKETYELGTPENVLVGIELKKDKEIRDRLSKILEEREAQDLRPENEDALMQQKLYDGALLYFAETAKALWPRMDIGPIERSVLYETYDEREHFTGLAKKIIGNAVISKPEDLTYWLNKETLSQQSET